MDYVLQIMGGKFFFFYMSTHQGIRSNGRKVGNAFKRQPSKVDMDALGLTSAVVVCAGMISGKH